MSNHGRHQTSPRTQKKIYSDGDLGITALTVKSLWVQSLSVVFSVSHHNCPSIWKVPSCCMLYLQLCPSNCFFFPSSSIAVLVVPMAPALPTGTRIHRHAGVNLEDHVPVWVQEKHGERTHLLWYAAWFRDTGDDSYSSDDTLDSGMIGGPRHLRT